MMKVFEAKGFKLTVPSGWKAFKVNERVVQLCKGGILASLSVTE